MGGTQRCVRIGAAGTCQGFAEVFRTEFGATVPKGMPKSTPLREARDWWVSNRCMNAPRTGQASGSAPAPPQLSSPGPGQNKRLATEVERPRVDPDATLRRVDAGVGPERSEVVDVAAAPPRPRPLRPPCRSNLTKSDERRQKCTVTKITCDHPLRIRAHCGYGNYRFYYDGRLHFSRISRAS